MFITCSGCVWLRATIKRTFPQLVAFAPSPPKGEGQRI